MSNKEQFLKVKSFSNLTTYDLLESEILRVKKLRLIYLDDYTANLNKLNKNQIDRYLQCQRETASYLFWLEKKLIKWFSHLL